MADVVTPYLSRSTFEGMFRPLSAAEGTLADMLLKAAAMWINARIAEAGRPPLAVDDPMAILVSYQVVRDALPAVPEMVGRTQYTIVTDDRTESGTISAAAGLLDFTEQMRILLGLPGTAQATWGGMNGDFGECYPSRIFDPAGNPIGAVIIGDFPQ